MIFHHEGHEVHEEKTGLSAMDGQFLQHTELPVFSAIAFWYESLRDLRALRGEPQRFVHV